jgi:predicted ATPase/class 3 adenylate cyclase
MPTRDDLPTGTVTFLFTDIEGSTRLTEDLGASSYGALLERHRQVLRTGFERHNGVEVGTEGDSFFVVFATPAGAVAAAADGQLALARTDWPADAPIRVRMGIHTGNGMLADGSYVGPDVNRAARIAAAGHGGQVLVSETTAALVARSPDGVRLRSLGRHRLKDLRPEEIAQLDVDGLPVEFPPIRSLDARPNNLPTQLTSFVGREEEVAEIVRLLGSARLVTLTGPGGTGKTRLSLQVAAETAADRADGTTFVALAPLADPELVPSAIATTLGLPDAGGRAPRDRIVDYLRDREYLLVLDNFEQVASAAPLVGDLLRDAARLRILVSSRVPLRISGEQEYPVQPLRLPAGDVGSVTAEAIAGNEAIRLFVDRARLVRPDFALDDANAAAVVEIVSRLDGLPLAIELAAARTRLLSPQAMLPRLERRLDLLAGGMRDLPERQQTIRGAIAWSTDLLDPPERRLFARFAVFVGGADVAEAEAVCGSAGDLGMEVLDGLESLVEHSLVRQVERAGEPRFFMLATIRDFAAEMLAESGEEETLRRRHALTYLSLAERAAPSLTTSDQRTWLDRLGRDHDNLRAVHGWALENREAAVCLRLVAALWRFWQIRGHLVEGRARTDAVLALPGVSEFGETYLAALEAGGGLCYWLADFTCAQSRYQEVLAARRAGGDPRAIAEALYNLGFTELFSGEGVDRARNIGEEALALFRGAGDERGIAKALWALGNVASYQNDPAGARRYCEEAIPILRALDEAFMLAWSLYTIGQVETVEGHLEASRDRLLEALDLFAAADDMSGFALVLDGLAINALNAGDHRRAARLSGFVASLEKRTGTGLNPPNRLVFGFDPAGLRDDPATAGAWTEGEGLSTPEAIAYAREPIAGASAGGVAPGPGVTGPA